MAYTVIRELFEAIQTARGITGEESEVEKLDLAQQMLVHGREFLDIGDYRAAWLRLSGAVSALESTGLAGLDCARQRLNELTPLIER